MNALVVVLLMLGGFLIMDAAGERRVARARRERSRKVRYVPLSVYDEQLSGKSTRDEISNLFHSSGPWMFRDDFAGIPAAGDAGEEEDALELAFSNLQAGRAGVSSGPQSVARERRRVEERVRAEFDRVAEQRLLKRAGVSPSDPLLEDMSPAPRGADRIRERRERRMRRAAAARPRPSK